MSSKPTEFDGGICSSTGCGKPTRSRGFCVGCYYHKLRSGQIQSGSQTRKFRHRLSQIDPENKTANCAVCGSTRISPRDKEHKEWRCATEANNRSKLYKRAYRASRLLANRCAICRCEKKLCWDHDHTSLQYRGTLCGTCNIGLGMFKDNPELLRRAILYLSGGLGVESSKR